MTSASETSTARRFVLTGRWAQVGLLGVWLVVALIHLAEPPDLRRHTWQPSYLLLEVLAGLSLAWRASTSPKTERVGWTLLMLSALLEIPSLFLSFLQTLGKVGGWAGRLTGGLGLATGVLALAGVLAFPWGGPRQGRALRRRLLDACLFAASLLFLLYVMGVQGTLRTAAPGLVLRMFVVYLNAALLGGGLVFMTSYHPDLARGPLGWLFLSALSWIAALSCWALAGFPADNIETPWILLAGGIPVFQGLAAWSFKSPGPSIVQEEADGRMLRWLPYLPFSLALLTMALVLPKANLNALRAAIGTFIVMVLLLLIRQVQAIHDLEDARRTLEGRVAQRTEALGRAQDMLLRTERLNSLALMGAGLAHDLNNLQGAIMGSADLVLMDLQAGLPADAHDLARISSAASRAAELTRRLMGFARREAEALQPVDLARAVRDMEPLLRPLLASTMTLQIEVPGNGAPMVNSSRTRVEQMMVNLVANARDAMPDGGHLCIRVQMDEIRGVAIMEVSDTGVGMTPATLERIFEPFFTTKPPGKGTGLGLPTIKAMVEEGAGTLTVESQLGKGTCCRIHLPLLISGRP